ncbi:type II toxin-antitoxin system PemK/MazF family toxin [Roseivivax sp.]
MIDHTARRRRSPVVPAIYEQNAVPIKYFPRAGQVLVCSFRGFEVPEMVKTRPVMVISPRLPHRSQIVTIVPISTSPPLHDLPFVVRLSKNYHPNERDDLPCWAKCDMVMNLSRERLDGFKIDRRKWATPHASADNLKAVQTGVVYGLGIEHLLASTD